MFKVKQFQSEDLFNNHIFFPFFYLFLVLADPTHQRAGGNLRYFEQLLMKQLREMNQDYQPPSEEPIQLGTYNRPKDHLPEREAYEALCRGEGIQMVSHHAERQSEGFIF